MENVMLNSFATVYFAYAPFIQIALGGIAVCAVYEFFFMKG
jgi:hypothetical protein